MEAGKVRADAFLDVSDDVSRAADEGLLGLAFDPDYVDSGLFYVYRIDASGDSVVSRFQTSGDPYLADRASEEEILRVAQPYNGQKGGQLAFGADGFLYIGLRDGGGLDYPDNRWQDGLELLGKPRRRDVGPPDAAGSIGGVGRARRGSYYAEGSGIGFKNCGIKFGGRCAIHRVQRQLLCVRGSGRSHGESIRFQLHGWPTSSEVGNTNCALEFAFPTAEAMGHLTRRPNGDGLLTWVAGHALQCHHQQKQHPRAPSDCGRGQMPLGPRR